MTHLLIVQRLYWKLSINKNPETLLWRIDLIHLYSFRLLSWWSAKIELAIFNKNKTIIQTTNERISKQSGIQLNEYTCKRVLKLKNLLMKWFNPCVVSPVITPEIRAIAKTRIDPVKKKNEFEFLFVPSV